MQAKKNHHKIYLLGTLHEGVSLSDLHEQVTDIIQKPYLIYLEANHRDVETVLEKLHSKYFEAYYAGVTKPYPKLMSKLSAKATRNVKYRLDQPSTKEYIKHLRIQFSTYQTSPALVDLVFSVFVVDQGNLDVIHPEMKTQFIN